VLILLNSIKPIISKVKLNQIDDYEDLYRQNDSNYNFSMASVGFIFTQFYLFDEQKGTAWAFDAYTDKKFHKEDSAGGGCGSGTCGSGADGGSSCGSDGGGCGGCGGCGGGD
jgi:hypothetical protein